MKKALKVLLGIILGCVILGFGGCVVSGLIVGKAVKDTATDISKSNKAEKEALAEMMKNAGKPKIVKSDLGTDITYTFKNTSKINFDYIELTLNAYDKNGTKLDTNMTNITDVKAGQTFQLTVNMYQDNYDHYDVNKFTGNPLD